MNAAISTVFTHRVERLPGTVQMHLATDRGAATHRLTPAEAQLLGRALARAGSDSTPEAHGLPGAPVLKPSGRIL